MSDQLLLESSGPRRGGRRRAARAVRCVAARRFGRKKAGGANAHTGLGSPYTSAVRRGFLRAAKRAGRPAAYCGDGRPWIFMPGLMPFDVNQSLLISSA